MLKHFDHLTIVVRDVDRAKAFFGVLGFKEAMSVVIAGEPFASYMGVPGSRLTMLRLSSTTPRRALRYNSCAIATRTLCRIRTSAIYISSA